MYGSILSKITGFDYRKLKVQPIKQVTKEISEEDASTTDGSKKAERPRITEVENVIQYNDQLTARELTMLESIFLKTCKKCDCIKVPMSHHCSICKSCISRMDHHCPWVNNCVGYYNQKHFLLFLIYVFLGSVHAMILIGMQSYSCYNANCFMFIGNFQIFIAVFSIFMALLFAIFVCVMFYD